MKSSSIRDGVRSSTHNRAPMAWMMEHRGSRHLIHALALVGLALIICGVLPVAFWLSFPLVHSDPPRQAGAIVILGGGVDDDDTLKPGSASRLVHGLRLFRKTYAPLIILTGGNPLDPSVPESEVMAKIATELGIPPSSLIVERDAATTVTQARAVAQIALEQHINSVLLVTSPLHSFRASRAFRQAGLEVISATPVAKRSTMPWVTIGPADVLARICDLAHVVYEYGAVSLYWLRGWI